MAVACGNSHTVFVCEDGEGVWTMGCGSAGCLGHRNEAHERLPRRIGRPDHGNLRDHYALPCMRTAMCGRNTLTDFTCLCLQWCLPMSGMYQFCMPCLVSLRTKPTLWSTRNRVVMLSAGSLHSAAVTSDGALWTWGAGLQGRLGLGDDARRLEPTRLPQAAFGELKVVMVACGSWHTLVMTVDGGVWSCGWGHLGRLGLGDECQQSTFKKIDAHHFGGSSVRMVAAGEAHSVRKFPFDLTFSECERECEYECE